MPSVVFIFLILIVLFLIYSKYRYVYWLRCGVPQIKPSLVFGNGKKMYSGELSMGSAFFEFYKDLKNRGKQYGGIYFLFEPFFLPISTKLIKSILVEDFQHWTDHGVFYHKKDFLTKNIFTVGGQDWKVLRSKFTPNFTSTKLKGMYEKIRKKINQLEAILEEHTLKRKPVDVKEICHCLFTDISTSCGFGVDYNSLENIDTRLRYYVKELPNNGKIRPVLEMLVPWNILGKLTYKSYMGKELEEFCRQFVRTALEKNETDSFFKILKELNAQKILTDNEIVAESLCYLGASIDTSAVITSNCLWELAKNQDIQRKLFKEINTVAEKYEDRICYEALLEMPYLEKVIKEITRLHTVFPVLFRICTKDYTIPGTDIVLKKGTRAAISVMSVHMDPEYYPNPNVFNPENFSEEDIKHRPNTTWLGFGDGPRKCLGFRLGLLEIKSTIAGLIKKFKFTLNNRTPMDVTLAKHTAVNHVEGCLWLDVTLR